MPFCTFPNTRRPSQKVTATKKTPVAQRLRPGRPSSVTLNPNAIKLETNKKLNNKNICRFQTLRLNLVLKKEIQNDLSDHESTIPSPGEAHLRTLRPAGWPRRWSSHTSVWNGPRPAGHQSPSTFDGEGSDCLRSSLKSHVHWRPVEPCWELSLLRQAALSDGSASFSPTSSGVKPLQLAKEGFPHCRSGL